MHAGRVRENRKTRRDPCYLNCNDVLDAGTILHLNGNPETPMPGLYFEEFIVGQIFEQGIPDFRYR